MFFTRRRSIRTVSSACRLRATRLAVEPLESRVVLTAGALDATFGGGGIASANMGPGANAGAGVQLDGDKILVAGTIQGATTTTGTGRKAVTTTDPGDFAIARYNADGSLDGTFSGDGRASVSFGARSDRALDMAVTPDGKYVVVGETPIVTTVTVRNKTTTTTSLDFAAARFNADGTLDTSFGVNGKQTIDFGGIERAFAVAVQDNGQVILAGQQMGTNFDSKFVLTRLNLDGSIDTTFGTNGKVVTNIGESDVLNDLGLQTINGETFIVAAGRVDVTGADAGYNYQGALVRYHLDGSLDTTFGTSGTGIVLTELGGTQDTISNLAIAHDGAIFGTSYVSLADGDTDLSLLRYTANGVFAGTTVVPQQYSQLPLGIALQADGKVVVAGTSRISTGGAGRQSLAVRFNADGQLDATFANGGVALWDVNPANNATFDEQVNGVAIQSDGKIVVAATVEPFGTDKYWSLTRLTADDVVAPSQESTEPEPSLFDLALLAMTDDDPSND